MRLRAGAVLLLGALALVGGCKTNQLTTKGCLEDRDCGDPASAYRCEAQTGVCYCRTDEACPGAQFCNTAGFCQDRSGCEKNLDCLDPSLFCDTTSGQCLARGRCTSDLQCALGEVCDTSRSQCLTGCRRNGDCPGTSCRCGEVACACTGTTPEELARCEVGVCDPQFCADESFCRFGEQCGAPADAGVTRAQCYSDFDIDVRPYCARCTSGGGIDTCGTGANFCIIDTRTASTYCGADCSEGQQCPRGYGCRDIRVVFTRWQCSATQPCPGDPGLPCATDEECKRGGTCLKAPGSPNGFCAGQCRIREGSSFGYCSCQVDSDCPLESCSAGECTITRRKCVTDEQCRTIRCVDFDGVGGCLIGQNCTPTSGLTCVEVQ
ncbi:MAG: hypothetical protein IT380_25800 [Myxococcales bacterium]|nr:hypothetical protein [Myxococcales bacterium]